WRKCRQPNANLVAAVPVERPTEMDRTWLTLVLALFTWAAVDPVRGNESPSLEQTIALNQTVQAAIRRAEPSIACILVSRSDAYRKLGDFPPADDPGKLGSFPAARKALNPFPERP